MNTGTEQGATKAHTGGHLLSQEAYYEEINRNEAMIQRLMPSIADDHKGQFALMRKEQIVEFFDDELEAFREGMWRFQNDALFSIHEITLNPAFVGIYSIANLRRGNRLRDSLPFHTGNTCPG